MFSLKPILAQINEFHLSEPYINLQKSFLVTNSISWKLKFHDMHLNSTAVHALWECHAVMRIFLFNYYCVILFMCQILDNYIVLYKDTQGQSLNNFLFINPEGTAIHVGAVTMPGVCG